LRRNLKSPIFDGAERAARPIACVGGGYPVSRPGSPSLGRPSSWLVSFPEGHQNLDPPVNWSNVRSDAIGCYQSGNAAQVDQVRSHCGGTRRHPTGSSTRSESHPANGALHQRHPSAPQLHPRHRTAHVSPVIGSSDRRTRLRDRVIATDAPPTGYLGPGGVRPAPRRPDSAGSRSALNAAARRTRMPQSIAVSSTSKSPR